tara:strand:+ start:35 stop:379 length:345 start_codon:yes stop_codon:yes gene_type:complete
LVKRLLTTALVGQNAGESKLAKTQTIRCINKDDRKNPYERITHVGGVNPDNSRWKEPQEKAIQEIDSGGWVYFVGTGDNRVRVVTAVSPYGNKYLKTEADGKEPNNLLSLPECP